MSIIYHSGFFSAAWLRIVCLAMVMAAGCHIPAIANCEDCDDCKPVVALKTNLLHDAVLTPDIGAEVSLGRHFSVSAEGVWARWSKNSAHRYWRVYGGWAELRTWFGSRSAGRRLTGHHIGIYGSMHTFDFEFGGKGWQSKGPVIGGGASYGYSLALNNRINLDFSARIGYLGGSITKYKPLCGVYSCNGHKKLRYVGPTSLEITLVWFPGRKHLNTPIRTH